MLCLRKADFSRTPAWAWQCLEVVLFHEQSRTPCSAHELRPSILIYSVPAGRELFPLQREAGGRRNPLTRAESSPPGWFPAPWRAWQQLAG